MTKLCVRNRITGIAVCLLLIALLCVFVFYNAFSSWVSSIIISVFILLIDIWFCVAYGREITFSPDGISIKFLFIKRQYAWSEYPNRRYFHRENEIGYRDAVSDGIEFSKRKHLRFKNFTPSTYCLFVHPFSYVFLSFDSPHSPQASLYYGVNADTAHEVFQNLHIDISK